jgi:hypothetical protein
MNWKLIEIKCEINCEMEWELNNMQAPVNLVKYASNKYMKYSFDYDEFTYLLAIWFYAKLFSEKLRSVTVNIFYCYCSNLK